MAAASAQLIRPPSYPKDGTYADLLFWHLYVWGTRPNSSVTKRPKKQWTKREFCAAIFGGSVTPDSEKKSYGSWIGNEERYAPGNSYAPKIARELFGGKAKFVIWQEDLEKARKDSHGPGKNIRSITLEQALAEIACAGPIGKSARSVPQNTPGPPAQAIPRPTAHFTGLDDECDALAKILISENSPAILVRGDRGTGKTELIKAVAHHSDVAAHFGERRYFVPLETATSAEAMLDAIVRVIGGGSENDFQLVLNTLRDKPWLLILDNLETPWEPLVERPATEVALAAVSEISGVALLASIRGRVKVEGLSWTAMDLSLSEFQSATAIDGNALLSSASNVLYQIIEKGHEWERLQERAILLAEEGEIKLGREAFLASARTIGSIIDLYRTHLQLFSIDAQRQIDDMLDLAEKGGEDSILHFIKAVQAIHREVANVVESLR